MSNMTVYPGDDAESLLLSPSLLMSRTCLSCLCLSCSDSILVAVWLSRRHQIRLCDPWYNIRNIFTSCCKSSAVGGGRASLVSCVLWRDDISDRLQHTEAFFLCVCVCVSYQIQEVTLNQGQVKANTDIRGFTWLFKICFSAVCQRGISSLTLPKITLTLLRDNLLNRIQTVFFFVFFLLKYKLGDISYGLVWNEVSAFNKEGRLPPFSSLFPCRRQRLENRGVERDTTRQPDWHLDL